MCLTSCEGALDDVLGEWSRPTPGNNTNTTPTTSSNYMAWNGTALAAEAIPSDAKEVTAATEKLEGGTYIVKDDVTITRAEGLDVTADSKLILCDGAKLTVNCHIEDETGGGTLTLSIYGQENQTGKLIITGVDTNGMWLKNIEIHGGDISVTSTTSTMPLHAIRADKDVSIYGGQVIATGADADASNGGANGIECGGNLTIKGKAIVKAYGGAESAGQNGGHGINVGKAIDISGSADVYAKSGKDAYAAILAGLDLTFSGKQLVTEGTGSSAGLETQGMGGGSITISAGTVTLTTANGQTIQSDANVNISKCTLSATVAAAPTVIEAGQNITIDNDVTKVDLTNSCAVGNGSTDMALLFINFTGTFKLGGTDVNTLLSPNTWNTPVTINTAKGVITTLSYDEPTKTLTYVP